MSRERDPNPDTAAALPDLRLLLARLVLCYGVVALAIYFAAALIGTLLARLAHDFITVSSRVPYLVNLEWTSEGYAATDCIPLSVQLVNSPVLLLAIGAPLGLALALPYASRVTQCWRIRVTLVVTLLVSAVALALQVDHYMIDSQLGFGIRMHETWRVNLTSVAVERLWQLIAVVFPTLMCAWLARDLLGGEPMAQLQLWQGSGKGPGRAAILSLCSLLAGLMLIDSIAQARIHAEGRNRAIYSHLESMNPDFGMSILSVAEYYVKQGYHEKAQRAYTRALAYPRHHEEAKRGIRGARMRALRRASSPGP